MSSNVIERYRTWSLALVFAISLPFMFGSVQAADITGSSASVANLLQTGIQLKADMLRIKSLAWDAPGIPSKDYKKAVAELGKIVNPKIAAFSAQLSGVSKRPSKSLIKANITLEEESAEFAAIFGRGGITVPPRIERAYQDAVIPALDTINRSLDQQADGNTGQLLVP